VPFSILCTNGLLPVTFEHVSLTFRDIDLSRHADVCVRFRADSYVCGDGSADRFWATAGPDGAKYLTRLADLSRDMPGSCVHAWLGDRIVGQVEMMRDPASPDAGKVNLFYLAPDFRGRGLGAQLERYAVDFLRDAGFTRAWLRVSPANARALAFYAKHGWQDRGRDRDHPTMQVMEKPLSDRHV
jgi:GNAT superfamily N-acetyltransferase